MSYPLSSPPGSPRDSSTTIVWSYRAVAELVDEMIEESEVDVVVVLVEEVIEDSELVRELVDVIDVFVVVVDEDLLPERDVRYTTDAPATTRTTTMMTATIPLDIADLGERRNEKYRRLIL